MREFGVLDLRGSRDKPITSQRTQYPLMKEHALDYRGLNIMI